MATRFGWIVACVASGLLTAAQARAESALPVLAARPRQLKIDGDLGDFSGARFVRLSDSDSGRAEVALAYDKSGLYIGARVFDDSFVRSDHPSPREDALVLRLGLPAAGSFETSELWMYAGRSGETPASAQLMAAGSKQAKPLGAPLRIVEGPLQGGYALEAFVPWSSLPHSNDWLFARGSLRLHDVDRGGAASDIRAPALRGAAAEASAQALPWLVFDGGPIAALSSFTKGDVDALNAARLDYVGDLRGDARAEHVVVYENYVLFGGSDPAFTMFQLAAASGRDVLGAEMRDLTGDGKPELIVSWREAAAADQVERTVWRVFDLRAEKPAPSFGIETRESARGGELECSVAVTPGGGGRPDAIRVRAVKSKSVTPDRYVETPDRLSRAAAAPPQVLPVPLPWGPWLERVYVWDGKRFAVASEQPNPKAVLPKQPAPVAALPTESRAQPPPSASASVSASGNYDAEALFALYRQTRGAAVGSARFTQRADVAGDARPESLALYGRECVIVGEGFRDGRDFFYFGLPARDAPDVLELSTQELTGDVRRDLVARIRQRIGAVTREILHVYSFAGESLKPVLAVEVARSQADHAIANKVAFVRERDHVVLHIAPGEARGWSAADYPFNSESSDGIDPLLLPWKDKAVRYQFDGQRLQSRLRTE